MAIAEGLAASKASFELLKGLRELLKRPTVDAGEINARLLELTDFILDTKNALGDAQEENRKLHIEIDELQRVADFGKAFEFEDGVYWYRNYPYCPNCYDAERKPIRLNGPYAGARGSTPYWKCSIHNSTFALARQAG